MYHWEQTRALTNRERARLQTFPDDFILQEAKKPTQANWYGCSTCRCSNYF